MKTTAKEFTRATKSRAAAMHRAGMAYMESIGRHSVPFRHLSRETTIAWYHAASVCDTKRSRKAKEAA